MKKISILSLLLIPTLMGCGNNDKDKDYHDEDLTVDYSSCPYIGTGSHYYVTAGTGSNYKTMHFFFDPDGRGAWGTTKIVDGETVSELYQYYFELTGEVNITFVEIESHERGSGFFTTDSTGQVFVSEGIHFYRYS